MSQKRKEAFTMTTLRQSDSCKSAEPEKKDGKTSGEITKGKLNGKRHQKLGVKHGGDFLLQAQKYVREKKKKKCEECGKRFSHGSHFEEHQRTHKGETLFMCFECGKRFSKRFNLERHQETHADRYHKAVTSKTLTREECNE